MNEEMHLFVLKTWDSNSHFAQCLQVFLRTTGEMSSQGHDI